MFNKFSNNLPNFIYIGNTDFTKIDQNLNIDDLNLAKGFPEQKTQK